MYTYETDATVEIVDEFTKKPIYKPTYSLKEKKEITQKNSSALVVAEEVNINYDHFNNIAIDYVNDLGLQNTVSTLIVSLRINVISVCEDFAKDNANEYVVSLLIPLNSKTLDINMTASIPAAESKLIACPVDSDSDIFGALSIAGIISVVALAAIFIATIFLTRNKDINYSIQIKRILNTYKSYIQKITNVFNTEGYQVLMDTYNMTQEEAAGRVGKSRSAVANALRQRIVF